MRGFAPEHPLREVLVQIGRVLLAAEGRFFGISADIGYRRSTEGHAGAQDEAGGNRGHKDS